MIITTMMTIMTTMLLLMMMTTMIMTTTMMMMMMMMMMTTMIMTTTTMMMMMITTIKEHSKVTLTTHVYLVFQHGDAKLCTCFDQGRALSPRELVGVIPVTLRSRRHFYTADDKTR